LVADPGDRQAIDRAGDGHHTAGAAVSDDGELAIIGRVAVLCFHRVGQHQQHQKQQQESRG